MVLLKSLSLDTAMKLGANHPLGPLALGDLGRKTGKGFFAYSK